MAHIKNRLRGLLVAFVALVAALAIVPGVANASDWIVDGEATNRTITVNGLKGGEELTLYQIAVVDYDNVHNSTELVNVPVAAEDSAKDFGVDETKTYIGGTGSRADADALIATKSESAQAIATYTVQQGETSYTFTGTDGAGFPAGLYYLQVTNPDHPEYTYSPMIVKLSPTVVEGKWDLEDATVTAKVAESDVEKYFVDEDGAEITDTVYAHPGESYDFEIKFSIPVGQASFVVTDVMDGFTYDDGTLVVKTSTGQSLAAGTDYIFAETGDGFTVTFTEAYLEGIEATTEFVINYSATLDADAPVTGATNKVTTTNDPDEGDEVTAEFGKVGVYKYTQDDEGVKTALQGVQFKLYTDSNFNNPVQVDGQDVILTSQSDGFAWTNAEGEITAEPKLEVGTVYYLQEFRTVDGYALVDTAFPVMASDKDAAEEAYSEQNTDGNYAEVLNMPAGPGEGVDLPQTGGAGTVALTAAGVVLVAGAAAFIVRSRKEN